MTVLPPCLKSVIFHQVSDVLGVCPHLAYSKRSYEIIEQEIAGWSNLNLNSSTRGIFVNDTLTFAITCTCSGPLIKDFGWATDRHKRLCWQIGQINWPTGDPLKIFNFLTGWPSKKNPKLQILHDVTLATWLLSPLQFSPLLLSYCHLSLVTIVWNPSTIPSESNSPAALPPAHPPYAISDWFAPPSPSWISRQKIMSGMRIDWLVGISWFRHDRSRWSSWVGEWVKHNWYFWIDRPIRHLRPVGK